MPWNIDKNDQKTQKISKLRKLQVTTTFFLHNLQVLKWTYKQQQHLQEPKTFCFRRAELDQFAVPPNPFGDSFVRYPGIEIPVLDKLNLINLRFRRTLLELFWEISRYRNPCFGQAELDQFAVPQNLFGTYFERCPGIEMPVLDKLDLINFCHRRSLWISLETCFEAYPAIEMHLSDKLDVISTMLSSIIPLKFTKKWWFQMPLLPVNHPFDKISRISGRVSKEISCF